MGLIKEEVELVYLDESVNKFFVTTSKFYKEVKFNKESLYNTGRKRIGN